MPRLALITLAALTTAGCSLTSGFSRSLADAMRDHPDPATVAAAAPTFLLLADALIAGDPDDTDKLLEGARLYGAYAGAMVDDGDRQALLAGRAFDYASRAVCEEEAALCAQLSAPFEDFSAALARVDDAALVYALGTAWATRIQASPGDWLRIAELPKVQRLMERSLELAPLIDDGGPHAYLAVLATLRPAALGGEPERAREHFEQAIAQSGGNNLMFKVLYARHYARMVFDQPLHDRLLGEVIAADPERPGLTLSNRLAQRQAAALLTESDAYF